MKATEKVFFGRLFDKKIKKCGYINIAEIYYCNIEMQ